MMNKLITAMILFVFGHILIWYQTNGQFKWKWFAEHPLLVAFIFAISHYQNGILAPIMVFLPGLAFSWNYYLYHINKQYIWGFLSTTILHFAYNFTLCVIIPMIYVVIDIYYGIDLLK